MSGDPERKSLAGAQRGTEGGRRRRRRRGQLKLHGYVRTLAFTQPPNICCFLLALHPYLPLSINNTGTKTVRGQLERDKKKRYEMYNYRGFRSEMIKKMLFSRGLEGKKKISPVFGTIK